MAKILGSPRVSGRKPSLTLLLGVVIALICLSTLKGIYVNLNNAYGAHYNPAPDLLISVFGGILLGFILGYWLKGRK